jgi:hypothetical protein
MRETTTPDAERFGNDRMLARSDGGLIMEGAGGQSADPLQTVIDFRSG